MIALKTAMTPLTAIPMSRNGSRMSHTSGYIRSASMARGQHKTNRINQSRNLTKSFLLSKKSSPFSKNVKIFLDEVWSLINMLAPVVCIPPHLHKMMRCVGSFC